MVLLCLSLEYGSATKLNSKSLYLPILISKCPYEAHYSVAAQVRLNLWSAFLEINLWLITWSPNVARKSSDCKVN